MGDFFRSLKNFLSGNDDTHEEEKAEPKVNQDFVLEPEKKVVQGKTGLVSKPVSTLASQKNYGLYTVYFTNGHLSKIDPYPTGGYYENRDIANNASRIISDGVMYDLTSTKSIYSIAVPVYTHDRGHGIGTTGFLEYVLRMRSGNYWNEGQYNLAIACLEKATQLMKYSTMDWPAEDFYRIVNELNDLGKFKSANRWKEWVEKNIPRTTAVVSSSLEERIATVAKESFKARVASCKELGTDLIQVGDIGACCSKCAMYRKRVYSLSRKNNFFPKFPDDFHFGCGLSAHPYILGIMEPSFSCENIIAYSNRTFIDDRTDEEIENYKNRLEATEKQPSFIREPNLTRIIYYRLKQLFPDDSPKSLSGFSRMRNANSKNYQALVKKAEGAGFIFPESLEDVEQWEENQ